MLSWHSDITKCETNTSMPNCLPPTHYGSDACKSASLKIFIPNENAKSHVNAWRLEMLFKVVVTKLAEVSGVH